MEEQVSGSGWSGHSEENYKNVNSPPCINGEIIQAVKKKETVRRKLKSFLNDALMNKFKVYENINDDLRNNLKRFWSIFKLKNKSSSVPETVYMGSDSSADFSASCPGDVAELFNKYFSKNGRR